MKSFKKSIVATIAASTIAISGIAVAQGWSSDTTQRGVNGGQGTRYNQQQNFVGPGRLLRGDMFKARVEVLADLSGQSTSVVESKLQNKPPRVVMDELNVDYQTFQRKMHDRVGTLVTQAVSDGKITQTQADAINQRRADGPRQGFTGKGRRGRGRAGFGMGRGRGNGRGFQRNNSTNSAK